MRYRSKAVALAKRFAPARTIRVWKLILLALLLLVAGAAMGWALLTITGHRNSADTPPITSIEIVKTILVPVVPMVAIGGLMLRIRRQSHIETSKALRDIKDSRLKAAKHLKSTLAAERLLGLQTLDDIGQNYPYQRQKVVDVWCAYLRSPLTHATPGTHSAKEREEERLREQLTDLLTSRLRPPLDSHFLTQNYGSKRSRKKTFWKNMDINLDYAMLIGCIFDGCEFRNASFIQTQFMRPASFLEARFRQDTLFPNAHFTHGALFSYRGKQAARFYGNTVFSNAVFEVTDHPNAAICFDGVHFDQSCAFYHTRFDMPASFKNVYFGGLESQGHDIILTGMKGKVDLTGAYSATTNASVSLPEGWKTRKAGEAFQQFGIIGWSPILRKP